jgi:RNA methyltransferase, TrmH family
MFTKGQASLIKSLHDKKNRQKTNLFLVEGEKSVLEVINSDFEIKNILVTKTFYTKYTEILRNKNIPYELVETAEIERVSALESNDQALAVVRQKDLSLEESAEESSSKDGIILALDNIRDPGNFGTIIRIADWYGVSTIIASLGTVDLYNPKVISATKGSFTRVEVFYTNLKEYLTKTDLPILGTYMEGKNVHEYDFPQTGILVMGNESNGVSDEISSLVTEKITIPAFGQKTESLNVAIATAISLDNWKRNLK